MSKTFDDDDLMPINIHVGSTVVYTGMLTTGHDREFLARNIKDWAESVIAEYEDEESR